MATYENNKIAREYADVVLSEFIDALDSDPMADGFLEDCLDIEVVRDRDGSVRCVELTVTSGGPDATMTIYDDAVHVRVEWGPADVTVWDRLDCSALVETLGEVMV